MAEAGDHILVGDLELGENILILQHHEEVIARVEMARAAVVEEVEEGLEEGEEGEEQAEETAPEETNSQQQAY